MTRRELLPTGLLMSGTARQLPSRLDVPLLRLVNRRCSATQVRRFDSKVWDEAVREFEQCGVALRTADGICDIGTYPSGKPKFKGLERSRINVLITDHVPLEWDNGRGLAGVATIYEGFHLCVVAMDHAHGHRVPFLAVNTVVHELLHVFLQDISVPRAGLLHNEGREARVDWYATCMWLFKNGAGIRDAVRAYLARFPKGDRAGYDSRSGAAGLYCKL